MIMALEDKINFFKYDIVPEFSPFGEHFELTEDEGVAIHFFNLLTNKRGEGYPNFPEFAGDVTRYNFEQAQDIEKISGEIREICNKFFVNFTNIEVDVSVKKTKRGHVLYIKLAIDYDVLNRGLPFPLKELQVNKKPTNVTYVIHKTKEKKIETKIIL